MKRITEIELTKSETLIISQPRQTVRPLCRQCGAATRMVKPDEAAILCGINVREIFRLIEAAAIHFEETANNSIYVCTNSVSAEILNSLTTIVEKL